MESTGQVNKERNTFQKWKCQNENFSFQSLFQTDGSHSPLPPPSYGRIGSGVDLPRLTDLPGASDSPVDPGATADRYANLGHGVIGLLAENLVSHPFVVIRRQCQVRCHSGIIGY